MIKKQNRLKKLLFIYFFTLN